MGALKIVTDNNELKEPKFNYKAELLRLVSNIDIVEDYMAVGKTAKRTPTKTGLTLFINECDKYKISYESAMIIVIDKGWRGFNYLWLKDEDFEKYGLRKKQLEKVKQQPITMSEIKNIISEEEKTIEAKKQINKCYLDYMDDLKNPDFPSIKFDFLVEHKFISVADNMLPYYERKRVKAIEILKDKYNPDKAITREEKTKFKQIYELLLSGASNQIEIMVKQMVLLEFFDKQIKDGKTVIFEL